MFHSGPTIAEHMRQAMLDAGQVAVTRADRDLLAECGRRCTHTNLMSVRRTERARRIFQALDLSVLFFRDKARGQSGWRVEYRLLESVSDAPSPHCTVCGSREYHIDGSGNIVQNPPR